MTEDAQPVRECPPGNECAGKYQVDEPVFTSRDLLWMLAGVSSRKVKMERKCALCGHVWEVFESKRPF